ncbi:MAG: flagellar hook-associated protein FlgK [Gammaproteobacteria bacterium]
MAEGILGTGVSGLLVAQRGMATASHNISNVNTEGYSRQRIDVTTRNPQPTTAGFVGLGAKVNTIERIYDEFQSMQIRSSASANSQFNEFSLFASQLDNLLADPDAGLMPTLQGFFDSVQGVANDPSSVPARQVMLTEANVMSDRFHYVDQRIRDLQTSINSGIESVVKDINSLSAAIAEANRSITNAISSGSGAPNDLLDHRDALIEKLSEKVTVQTYDQGGGAVNVFIGNGQAVVAGFESRPLSTVGNIFDNERLEVGYSTNSSVVNITSQLTGGSLGGMIDFRNQILDAAQNNLGHLAVGISSIFNTQHRLGVDMNGVQGGDFFTPIDTSSPIVHASSSNTGNPAAQIGVVVSDANALTPSDYRLDRTGSIYSLTRLSDGNVTTLSTFPGGSETVDGMTLSLSSGLLADGDSFLIQPVRNGARDVAVALNGTSSIAAGSPVRTTDSLANTGTATTDSGSVSDPAAYDQDSYTIYAVDTTAANANGVVGTITDNAATNNALEYRLVINGVVVHAQNEAAGPLANKTALAAAINDDVSATGVRAYVDTVSNTLYLANEPPTAMQITVTEQLVDANNPALALDAGDSVTGYFGSALTGGSPNSTITYSGAANSYIVIDSGGNTETSGTYTNGVPISFNGVRTTLSGQPNLGDNYSVTPNTNGVGDNRNALALAGLQTNMSLSNGTTTFEGAYSQMVVDVGAKTHQANINRDATAGLLEQANQARESKSGVNLDEEAASLIKFQQAYQAAAQVISVADEMFQALLGAVRR